MQRRFVFQFLLQIGLLSFLVFLCITTLAVALGFYVSDSEYHHDLHQADELFLNSSIKRTNDGWQLEEKFKETVEKQEGWIVLYDVDGNLLHQYNAPANEKLDYKNVLQQNSVNYYTLTTVEPFNEEPFIVLYATKNKAAITLNELTTIFDWSQEQLPAFTTGAIVYFLSPNGKVFQTLNTVTQDISINDVMKLQNNEQFETASYTDETTGKILVVAYERVIWDDLAFFSEFKKPFFIGLAIAMCIFLAITFFYAKKFGSPLLIMMDWIRQLGKKNYDIPTNNKGQALLFNKKGNLKRKYKLYKELFETLENVTLTLKKNEEQQKRIEKTREEWISSLSHDLKTPLSSIIGYVKMLQSDYDWTKDERLQFYEVMDEKSQFMMKLIEDLTLTYRLKNEQFPIYKDVLDLNEFIRRTVIDMMNNKAFNGYDFDLKTSQQALLVELDLKWLQRILDNLLLNTIKHNPPGTSISVIVENTNKNVTVSICDNGVGMDEETVEHLFNRYYRGTNTTESIDGTGLGMAITKELILLQGGCIEVHSELEKGTQINILFPLHQTAK